LSELSGPLRKELPALLSRRRGGGIRERGETNMSKLHTKSQTESIKELSQKEKKLSRRGISFEQHTSFKKKVGKRTKNNVKPADWETIRKDASKVTKPVCSLGSID